jgi:large subunit ribosomal protein L10
MPLKADPTTPQIAKKAAVIDEIKGKLQAADAAVLTEYRGLSVDATAELRNALRPAGTEYKIYKNTLVRRAATEAGLDAALEQLLAGPVAIAFVQGDAAAAAKALRDFARTNPALVIKGGLLGERGLSSRDIDALAELPSKETLLAQIAGLFEAPLAQTLAVVQALLVDTVGLVQARIDQLGGAPDAPANDEPATEPTAAEGPATEPAAADEPTEATADAPTEAAPAEPDQPTEAAADAGDAPAEA